MPSAAVLFYINHLFKHCFKHIVFSLRCGEAMIHRQQTLDLRYDRLSAFFVCDSAIQLSGQLLMRFLRCLEPFCNGAATIKKSIGIVYALLQQVIDTAPLLFQRGQLLLYRL